MTYNDDNNENHQSLMKWKSIFSPTNNMETILKAKTFQWKQTTIYGRLELQNCIEYQIKDNRILCFSCLKWFQSISIQIQKQDIKRRRITKQMNHSKKKFKFAIEKENFQIKS